MKIKDFINTHISKKIFHICNNKGKYLLENIQRDDIPNMTEKVLNTEVYCWGIHNGLCEKKSISDVDALTNTRKGDIVIYIKTEDF